MTDKKLVGNLVDYYWEVSDTIDTLEMLGTVGTNEMIELKNLLISLDKILTNSSKRWAKGKRESVAHIEKPVKREVELALLVS